MDFHRALAVGEDLAERLADELVGLEAEDAQTAAE